MVDFYGFGFTLFSFCVNLVFIIGKNCDTVNLL